jgi:FkbM family methyltransferase
MDITVLKRTFKQTVPHLPGYHQLCLFIRRHRPTAAEWIDRIPVKPGLRIPVHAPGGVLFMSRPERCSTAKRLFWTDGIRQPAEDRRALNLFAGLARKADVALDIGANSGLFSLVAARSNGAIQVIAFDILPEAYHILVDNLILNNLLDRVECKLLGVGVDGAEFLAPFNNVSSEMTSGLSVDSEVTDLERVTVKIASLDTICLPRFVGKRVCIKIDVEGTEVDIFANGRETLRRIQPDIISEVLPSARQIERYDRILDDHGYHKYLITESGFERADTIQPHRRYRDWFFTASSWSVIELNESSR